MYHNGILTAIDMKTSSNTTSGTFVKTFNSMLNEMSYDMKNFCKFIKKSIRIFNFYKDFN